MKTCWFKPFFFVLICGMVTVIFLGYYRHQLKASDSIDVLHDGQYIPKVSRYRERFLFWYHASPDVTAAIGPDQGQNASQYLIYRCDTTGSCGGMVDRIEGMIATYLIANLTGRKFKAEVKTTGCDLDLFLMPNLVNWTLPKSFHENLDKMDNDTTVIYKVDNMDFYNSLKTLNLTNFLGNKKFVYFRTNLDHSTGFKESTVYERELSWMKMLSRDQVMAIVYKRLFVLHPRLHAKVQNFLFQALPTNQHKLVCVHLRMGKNPTLPSDTFVFNFPENLPNVWDFIKNHSKTAFDKVFVMTDSTDALEEAYRQSFGSRIVNTPGPVLHVEKSRAADREEMCQAQEKVLLDQHILMNCDVLMISKSGISKIASYVRASSDGLYCWLKDGSIIPCTPSTAAELTIAKYP